MAALAHPFGASSAAHRLELEVTPSEAVLHYLAEVPLPVVRANARLRPGADPISVTTTELVSGLVLTVDGVGAPLQVQGPASVRESDDAVALGLTLAAHLPADAARIEVTNGNLPEVPAFNTAAVRVHPDLAVTGSSLLTLEGGRVVRDATDRWEPGEAGRRLWITVEKRSSLHRAVRWLGGVPGRPVPHARALPSGPEAALRSTPPSVPGTLVGLVAGLVLGLGAPPTSPGARRAVPVALGLGLLLTLVPAPFAPWMDLGLAALTVLAAWRPRWLPLAAAALVTAAHAPALGLVLALVIGLATLAGRSMGLPAERLRPLLGLLALWLALRGLFTLLGATGAV